MLRTLALILLAIPSFAQSMKVMTFNVRYPNPGDGPDVWSARRDLLVETIAKEAPDLMGTQELFHEQGQYIVEKLPGYAWFGRQSPRKYAGRAHGSLLCEGQTDAS